MFRVKPALKAPLDDVRLGTGTKSRGTANSNECGWSVAPEPALWSFMMMHYTVYMVLVFVFAYILPTLADVNRS